jgi:hypothetical protein
MRLGIRGQRQPDAPVGGHPSHLGAAEAEAEHDQSLDPDRHRQFEADQHPEWRRIVRGVEGHVGLQPPGAGPVEPVPVLRGQRRAQRQFPQDGGVVVLVGDEAGRIQRVDVDAFVDGDFRGPVTRCAEQQQPDIEELAVRVDAELARGAVARAGAAGARPEDGGQGTLAHGPQGLAIDIHEVGFSGLSGTLAGGAADSGI